MEQIMIPEGEYWIGDPQLVLPAEVWDELTSAENKIRKGFVLPVESQLVVALKPSQYRDEYLTSDDDILSQESGYLGLVPAFLVDESEDASGAYISLSEESALFQDKNKNFEIEGVLTIYSGQDEEEDEDDIDGDSEW